MKKLLFITLILGLFSISAFGQGRIALKNQSIKELTIVQRHDDPQTTVVVIITDSGNGAYFYLNEQTSQWLKTLRLSKALGKKVGFYVYQNHGLVNLEVFTGVSTDTAPVYFAYGVTGHDA